MLTNNVIKNKTLFFLQKYFLLKQLNIDQYAQIASPSKSRLGFVWATVGPWDLHGLGVSHSPPGQAHCWPVVRSTPGVGFEG